MSADDLLVLVASYVLFVLSVVWLVAMLLTVYIGVSHLLYFKKGVKEKDRGCKKDIHKIDL